MGSANRSVGKKNVNGQPHINALEPTAALPGGEVRIVGSGLNPLDLHRPQVRFGEADGSVVVSTSEFVIARVPETRHLRTGHGFNAGRRQ